MHTYLSIDIDYWNDFMAQMEPSLHKILRTAKRRGIPVIAVTNHQQLLKSVDAGGCQRLVNLDMHSDLAPASIQELHCGTWVSYVRWRRVGTYVWLHPHRILTRNWFAHRDCKDREYFRGSQVWCAGSDWQKARAYRVICNKPESLCAKLFTSKHPVKQIGICLSPAYTDARIYGEARDLIKSYGIPIVRGRKNEDRLYCKRTPCGVIQ